MLLVLYVILALSLRSFECLSSSDCSFNSMCSCSLEEHDFSTKTIHSVSCLSVPFYKFPNFPEGGISQLEVVGTKTTILEAESLAGCQVQALILTNNHLQRISDRAFSSLWNSLTSLDLSYNKLDSIPAAALKDIRNLQWINLHGNQISSIKGAWSHMKISVTTLFLGENDITSIPNDTFNGPQPPQSLRQFESLIWLNLDDNRISEIPKDSLPTCLKTASLSYNLIREFPSELIASSPYLRWLYLRGNNIKSIPRYNFSRMLYMEKIDLAENLLSGLPAFAFNGSLNIRDVNLAFNDFRTLNDNYFAGLNTGRIILSYNSIEKIEYDAFGGILSSLEYLDLDHNDLQTIPDGLKRLNALKYLYLSSNLLKTVDTEDFDEFSHSLKALSLSGNRLSVIPSLQNCTKLVHFNVASNEISRIDDNAFRTWGSSIRSLVLSNNRLTELREEVFVGLDELRELSLSFNPLRRVDKNCFEGLSALESLEISFGVEDSELNCDIFDPLINLKWLSLDNDNIASIHPSSFPLPDLVYLNLESNKIPSIPRTLFKPDVHSKLREVRLSRNELTLIETDTFRTLSNLETILLSDNKIRYVQRGSFFDLPKLSAAVLSHNRLRGIDRDAFANLSIVVKIDFHDNLLTEISFSSFANISGALRLNFSSNRIASCLSDARKLNVRVLDLRVNNLGGVPTCVKGTSSLRELHLDANVIDHLNHSVFSHLTSLEHLGLRQNNIETIKKRSFYGLKSLQSLDLSQNFIKQLHVGQFANMSKLRILNLSGNHLSYLPKEIFKSTHVEMLDLSYNLFSVVPSATLSEIGISLQYFSMRSNNNEHIDITTFPDIPLLQHLDLGNNKLTILPDNVFTSLGSLQTLDLSSNPLRSNFKELFHYAQSLRHLSLADTGIVVTPHFPLPDLITLNLSRNNIERIGKGSVQQLTKLKSLDLSHNNLAQIPSQLWIHLPNLKTLDLSHNPTKELLFDSFANLHNLRELNVRHLHRLTQFDGDAISRIAVLSKLSMQTWPKIENFNEKLCRMLSYFDQLRVLKIYFVENELTDQLLCLTNKKIRQLEITGKHLKSIHKDAFAGFTKNPELTVTVQGTQIEELPTGLFSNMFKIAHLTINLNDNMLTHLHPEIFYGNSSGWKNVGTTLISGGLFLSNNPFRCGCHLSWLSHWLRRWTRESLQSHNSPVEEVIKMNEVIKESTCIESTSGVRIPIVDLEPEDMSCQASALSNGTYSNEASVIFVMLLVIIKYLR